MDTREEKSSRKRFVIWALVFVLFCALVGVVGGKALSNEQPTDETIAVQTVTQEKSDKAQRCCTSFAKKAARKFRRGKIRKDRGYKPGKVFYAPRKAAKVWVNKIERAIARQCKSNSSVPTCRQVTRCDRCRAWELYREQTKNTSCATAGEVRHAYMACGGKGPRLTKRQVQVGGSVVLCGAAVAMGVVTAPPTRGASVAFVAFLGATSCGWGFWITVDPGGGSWRT